jgi:polyisoprenyl-teichoic acid--peptidoglycan teichoic acid transferase
VSNRDGAGAVPGGGRKRRPPRRTRPSAGKTPEAAQAPAQGEAPEPPRGEKHPREKTAPPGGKSPRGEAGARSRGKAAPAGGTGETAPRRKAPSGAAPGPIGRIRDGLRKVAGPSGSTPRFAKPLNLSAVIGWTLLSIVAPGAAHLRAGRRRIGLILLSAYAVLLLVLLALGLMALNDPARFTSVVEDGMLVTLTFVSGAAALTWFAIVVSSYVVLRPSRLNQQGQIISGILVGILCVAVMAPFAWGATTIKTSNDAITKIFPSDGHPDTVPVKEEDPWNGKDRVNFLLIGGDAAGNRTGVRTDSLNVASVDIATGNTVLFSLPRNLQHVRFPPTSPLRKQFPNGFMAELGSGGLLNEVWQYANDHPELAGGKNKGPRVLMDAIGYTLGLKIDYYALMNMYGFADLVDAIGGLKIQVQHDVPWGGTFGTAGTIKAGYRRLTGEQALWYGRSRVGSDDFSRMGRQRCVIAAFAQQATPDVILQNFSKIAGAATRMAQTNIPRDLLPPLMALGLKVKDAKISSLQFVPPAYWPGSADWPKIRKGVDRAIKASMRPARRAQAADVTSSPGATATSPSPSRSVVAKPSQTPTRNSQKAEGESIDELCGL